MATATRSHYGYASCKYPGCSKPRYKEPASGFTHDFCGRTHANMYAAIYLTPTPTTSTYKPSQKTKTTSTTTASSASKSRPGPLKALHSFFSKDSKEIKFYNSYEPYYEFTNFYRCGIIVDDKYWPTSEHYFQAQKFVGTPYLEKIRKLPSAREAFQYSRDPSVSRWRRSDWDQVKDDIMLKALRCKFEQDSQLRSLLLETGDKKLIEHTENDSYWGDGGGGGKNMLGTLLMQVRGELRSKYGSPKKSRPKRSGSFSLPSTKTKHKHSDDMALMSGQNISSLRRFGSAGDLPSLTSTTSATYPTSKRVHSFSGSQNVHTHTKNIGTSVAPARFYGTSGYSSVGRGTPLTSGNRTSQRHSITHRSNDSSQMASILNFDPYKTTRV